jgi:hypothetical protein
LLLRVFYVSILYNTVYELHSKYNFPVFGGKLLLRVFFIPILYYTLYKLHFKYNFPRFLFMSVRACSFMRAAADACVRTACAYCKKCRVNLGSKGSSWPNVPSAWFLEWFFGVLGQCVIRKSAEAVLETCFYARDTENGRC